MARQADASMTRATLAAAGIAAAGAVFWAWRDYRAWIALGTGGLPPSPSGWLRTTYWRTLKRDPLSLAPFGPGIGRAGDAATLSDLPRRRGPRPRVGPHPVPHRQLSDYAPTAVLRGLEAAFDAKVAAEPGLLTYARSHFEKHNKAVTLRCPECGPPDTRATHGEIGHIHPSDGSMHMVLSCSDAAAAVEAGWGERHGLAGVALGLPLTYMLIYAPRDASEVAVIATILDAAVAHMTRAAEAAPGASAAAET